VKAEAPLRSGPRTGSENVRVPVRRAPSLWLRIGYWACIVIAVAVVVRRVLALAYPPRSAPPQLAGLDAVFASHAALTLAHIIPALACVLLTPFFIFRRSQETVWAERLLFPLGVVVAITAYAMTSIASIGGWTERSAILFFNTLFLFSLFRAWLYWQRGKWALQRRWMLRAIVVLLGIATTRPVVGLFFATSPLTHLTPSQFFGVAFWIGFSINTVAIELWLRSHDRSRSHVNMNQ
jgi:hypothetical protein